MTLPYPFVPVGGRIITLFIIIRMPVSNTLAAMLAFVVGK
jgi:hypothetical protein